MSKITNDGLTRSGAGCFIAVPIMATVGVKELNKTNNALVSIVMGKLQFRIDNGSL